MRTNSPKSQLVTRLPELLLKRSIVTPTNDLAWRRSDVTEVLVSATESDVAILGGDMLVMSGGKFLDFFPDISKTKFWDTGAHTDSEDWSSYCRRTLDESIAHMESFEGYTTQNISNHEAEIWVAPVLAVQDDSILMVPRDKHDHARAELAIAAGYPAVEPILAELLEWIQDMNWPVAQTLAPFLASIELPLLPHLRRIFETDDELWKYWVMLEILQDSRSLTFELSDEIRRIAYSPETSEVEEGIDEIARELLERHGLPQPDLV